MTSTEAGAAVVTGASTGIGAATVQAMVQAGYQTFGTVRRARDAAGVEAAGATALILDVTYPPTIARGRDTVERALAGKPLRALVNNAGIPAFGPLEHIELETVRRVFDVNVVGVVAMTQAFLPLLRASGGRVINISSVSARLALPFAGPYAASKFALEGISDSLRRELAGSGVWVTVVQPGSVRTAIWEKIAAIELERYAGTVYGTLLQRLRQLALRSGERGIPAAAVADVIVRVVQSPHPPIRVLVTGKGGWRHRLSSLLPDRLLDRMVARRVSAE
jgi:NAD(P)-dependent dehydrogenase (short-subunit alcohol dehydrogenase family)